MLTKADCAAIRARAEKATKGPWRVDEWHADNGAKVRGIVSTDTEIFGELYPRSRDAAFIAAARQDIPALLDTVQELRTKAELIGEKAMNIPVENSHEAFYKHVEQALQLLGRAADILDAIEVFDDPVVMLQATQLEADIRALEKDMRTE